MKKYLLLSCIGIFVLGLFLFSWSLPVAASPNLQLTPFPTPTPGGDGRIWYRVQPGDSLWHIAAVSGVSLDELRLLNNMDPDDILVEGSIILLGIYEISPPATAVIEPGDGAAPVTETPVPDLGTAIICIILYDDRNGDSFRQETEVIIEGGAVSLTEQTGLFSDTRNTSAIEEDYCFVDLPGGKYTISMAIPEGYNPTDEDMTTVLEVNPGETSLVNFGAQETTQAQSEVVTTVDEVGTTKSPLLGILGIVLLLAGIGLGVFTSQKGRKKPEGNS